MLNERISSIAPSVTLAITSKAKALAAEGREIYSFSAGEPDFDTPDNVKDVAKQAIDDGQTKYAPVAGLPALRSAIADKLKDDNNLDYKPEDIVVSNGAKHSLFNIIMAICNDGDEVIIPAPYWLSYPEMVRMAGGVPVFVDGSESAGFKITAEDVEKAATDKSKAIILNSPSNPIGIVYTGEEIRALCEVAVKKGMYIISDEIYEKVVYDGTEHVSAGSLSSEIFEKTITVNGFSKFCSMTGWRLGYFAGPTDIVKAVTAFQSHSTSGANTFAQFGAVEALRDSDKAVEEMLSAFDKRRIYLYDRLNSLDGVTCVKPMGAFYVLPNISSFGMGSLDFAGKLLDAEGVAVVPGAAFGADGNIRMSYACSMENIEQGMDRIEKFLTSL